jgi:hypothetical protein
VCDSGLGGFTLTGLAERGSEWKRNWKGGRLYTTAGRCIPPQWKSTCRTSKSRGSGRVVQRNILPGNTGLRRKPEAGSAERLEMKGVAGVSVKTMAIRVWVVLVVYYYPVKMAVLVLWQREWWVYTGCTPECHWKDAFIDNVQEDAGVPSKKHWRMTGERRQMLSSYVSRHGCGGGGGSIMDWSRTSEARRSGGIDGGRLGDGNGLLLGNNT